jgi:prevent-host-death family protein
MYEPEIHEPSDRVEGTRRSGPPQSNSLTCCGNGTCLTRGRIAAVTMYQLTDLTFSGCSVTLRHMKTVSIRELHAKTGELVRDASRHGHILVTDNGRTIAKIIPETNDTGVPYFAQRNASTAFSKLDASGKTGGGTDVTHLISEDREDRV